MGRVDKELKCRLEGMLHAYNIAKDKGVDAIKKELVTRGFLRAPFGITEEKYKEWYTELSDNLYANMLTAFMYALHNCEGWGPVRLKRLKGEFDKTVQDVLDLDYMGQNYITLADYATELNEKFDMGIDLSRVSYCQRSYNEETSTEYHMAKIESIIRELKDAGYGDAAEFLEKKLD